MASRKDKYGLCKRGAQEGSLAEDRRSASKRGKRDFVTPELLDDSS